MYILFYITYELKYTENANTINLDFKHSMV